MKWKRRRARRRRTPRWRLIEGSGEKAKVDQTGFLRGLRGCDLTFFANLTAEHLFSLVLIGTVRPSDTAMFPLYVWSSLLWVLYLIRCFDSYGITMVSDEILKLFLFSSQALEGKDN